MRQRMNNLKLKSSLIVMPTYLALLVGLSACTTSSPTINKPSTPLTTAAVNDLSEKSTQIKTSIFTYPFDSEINIAQTQAVVSGTFIWKEGCIFLKTGDEYTTPLFPSSVTIWDEQKQIITIGGYAFKMGDDIHTNGGYGRYDSAEGFNKELEKAGNKKCLKPTLSGIGTQGLVDESVDPEIRYYLEQYNISIEEAERILFFDSNRDPAFEALQKEFSGRIAGSYIEHEPNYKYVLRLTGTGEDTTRLVKIYDRSRTGKYKILPVEIKYGARFTKEEARLQQAKSAKLVSRYFSKLRITGYDEEKNIIVADVHGKPTPENLELVKKVQSEWGEDKLPLTIEFVSYSISPL